jgi:hypothetical protein
VIVQGLPRLPYTDEIGSQTPGRLRPGDLNLDYNICHICRSAWSKSTDVLSCTPSLVVVPNEVIWGSSGRSSGGRVGYQLGRLGPLDRSAGLLVGRTHLSGRP